MQHRSEETRAKILAVAESLFAQKGYDATGVADICEAADVSKGAFYHHFPAKQAVFQALLEGWLAQLDAQMLMAFARSQDVPSGLSAMAGETGPIFAGANSRSLIFLEFWMQASRQPEIWQIAVAPYHRYVEVFSGLIQKGIQEGSIRPDVEPRSAAQSVIAVAMGLFLQAFFDPQGENWQQITQRAVGYLVDGLAWRVE
jgi:AcrR family transcriptional regulator